MNIEIWNASGNVAGQAAALARRAEAEGFDGLSFGDTQCLSADPFVGLAVAAGATRQLKLGVGVTNPLTRHPAVVACAVATLQAESGGRAVLGIGRGDSAVAKLGMRAAPVAVLDAYLEQLQRYLAGQEATVDGHRSALEWLTGQSWPKVPVDVAATGPAVIAIGAKRAERVTFNVGANKDRLDKAIALARQARAEVQAPQAELSLGAYINVVPHPDRSVARDLIKGVLATYARFSGMPGHPVELLDPADASVITALGQHYDGSRHARSDAPHVQYLNDDFIDRFGVAGPPEHCIEKLVGLFALGLDRLAMVGPAPDGPPELVAESRQLLVDVVLPAVRTGVAKAQQLS